MSAPHLNPALARFIASRSVSLAGLQRWLSKATKVPGRARAAIEHGHQRWLGKVGQDATALVAGAGVPPLQALRNAVATALPADLPVWSHVMDCDALGAFGTPVEVRAIIDVARLRYQPDSNWLPSALKAVQCAASATPSAVLPAVRSSWQVALAVIEEMPAPEALEAMREVIDDRCRRGNADPDSTDERWRLRLIAGCEALLGRRHDLRFGYEQFRELPADLRGAIKDLTLWVTDAGRARMAQIARRRAKRDAQQGARLEAAIGAFVGAIDELVSQKTDRCWGKVADALVELRAAGGGRPGRDCDPRLLECLARSSAEWLLLPHAPKPVLDRLARAGRSPIARASWFLAAPRAIQCRSRLCHHDEGLAGLPLAIPAPMHRAIVDCATSEYVRVSRDRARIWNLWKPIETFGKRTEHDGIVADAWATAFSEGRKLSKDELPRFFRWIDMLTPSKLQKLEAEHGPWLTRRARRPAFVADMFRLRSRAATTWVLGLHSVLRYSNAVAAVAKMSNRDRREALTSDLRALLTMGPEGSHGSHKTIAARLTADGVRQLGLRRTIELLDPVLDASRLIALLKSCDDEQLHSKGAIATLRAAVTMGPTRLSRAMRQALDTKEGLPDAARHAVWAATYSASPDRALKLLIRHPKQFAEVACASAPLPWLVGSAATKPGLAAHLSPHLERSRLVAALPVIRKQFGVRRRSCAVTELAIMSDLREMDHLRAIAWAGRGATNLQAGCLLDSRYRTYELPKRSGGVRIITAPDPRLKRLQRRLLVGAFEAVPLHDAVHGFRSGRSIATNAARHVGQRLVVNVDIEGFFPNTKFQQVLSACKRVDGGRLSPYAARLLAEICCYAGALPTGAPTSPAVANIVLRPADTAIAKSAATHGISYTRYADDLTFSGEGDAKRIIPFVRRVLAQAGYRLDQRKTQLYRRGRQQLVTNLVVNDRVNLRRSDRRRLRAAVHHRCVGRPAEWHGRAMNDHALEGRIALLAMVDRKEADLLLARLRSQASGWRSRDA